MPRDLTVKQQKFVEGVVGGLSQSEAYRQAGYKVDGMTTEVVAVEACKLAKKPNVSLIIAQRRQEMANNALWTREQALAMLQDIAIDANKNRRDGKRYNAAAHNVAIKAIEQANKMCGYNAPEKSELDVNLKRLEDII